MVATYLQAYTAANVSPWFLLVGLPNFFGGIPPGMVDDEWSHPLITDRWRAAVAEVRLTPGPVVLLLDSVN